MNAKALFRKMAGFAVALPMVLNMQRLSRSMGREKAIKACGPDITAAAKLSLKLWVPEIASPEDFEIMTKKMRSRFWIWKPFFDIAVTEDDRDTFKLKVTNCPFCEALRDLGYPELAPFVCEGDWAKARENAGKWWFARSRQIGTGDSFCDHTYLRIKP
ncbi:L-2-amino-thiazoline-4-carboxylic acid hydrolase [Thermodesulfobacteriota bacterium]